MEQPTIFYAIALTLALMNFGGGINYLARLGLCRLRIVHSLIQAPSMSFVPLHRLHLASICLIGLTVHAGIRIIHIAGIIG